MTHLGARSVAYIVCDALGLGTSDYSFAYVAQCPMVQWTLWKDTSERVIGCRTDGEAS